MRISSPGPYGDLAAQLDLWTNVSFASDEPFVAGQDQNGENDEDSEKKDLEVGRTAREVVKRKRDQLAGRKNQLLHHQQQHPTQAVSTFPSPPVGTAPASSYDLPSLLTMTGNQFPAQAMNLNQLLALQAYQSPFPPAFGGIPFNPPSQLPFPPPSSLPTSPPSNKSESEVNSTKRSKTSRKNSTASAVRASTISSEGAGSPKSPDDGDEEEQDGESSSRPLNMTEDKRRRNTQASARFRLKKKEREHAMEARSKELETKVNELEKECESLRRENGWLKGLVVGVTGGTGMQMTLPTGQMLPTLSAPTSTSNAPPSKRRRSDPSESESA